MAYYGGKAAVMGCSADLVLACKKELYHFDAYNVHAFGVREIVLLHGLSSVLMVPIHIPIRLRFY